MCRWKHFENRSIFGEDMDKSMWLSFFGAPCTCWVIAYFVSNFVAMTTGVSRCRIVCHHSIATSQTRKTAMCKDFGYISYTSWVRVDCVSNFIAMATGVGCGGIFLTSVNSPTSKPPDRRTDISYTSWVTVDFVSNFVAMATGVGRGRICLTSFNSATLIGAKISAISLIQVEVQSILCQISLPWQQGLVVMEYFRDWRNDLGDISCTSRAIADFV